MAVGRIRPVAAGRCGNRPPSNRSGSQDLEAISQRQSADLGQTLGLGHGSEIKGDRLTDPAVHVHAETEGGVTDVTVLIILSLIL